MRPPASLLLAAILATAPASPLGAQAGVLPPRQALNEVRLVDLDGRVWTARDLQGRVTVIDFWATWCPPCVEELPFLREARRRYRQQDLEIVGVSVDVIDRRTFVSWINRHRVDWPQVFDGRGWNGSAPRRFDVTAVPYSVVVGRDGRVAATGVRAEQLLAVIDREVRRPVGR